MSVTQVVHVSDLTGTIHHADCFDILTQMPEACINLCYLDPPFNTGRTRQDAVGAYADAWESIDAYLAFMQPRIEYIHRVLRDDGSILLHCDWRTSHHLRLMLDSIFGEQHFVNHLIWTYGLGGSSPRRFARKHDDILFYARSDEYYFSPPMVPATSRRMEGQLKKATDVLDIPAINNMAAERLGYPTQKPIALLEMLISACCPDEGIVFDPFCGSGTALHAAQRLGRMWIGIDRNPDAVGVARNRLAGAGEAQNVPTGHQPAEHA